MALKRKIVYELERCHKRKIDIVSREVIRQLFYSTTSIDSSNISPPLPVHDSHIIQEDDQIVVDLPESETPIATHVYTGSKLFIPGNVLHLKRVAVSSYSSTGTIPNDQTHLISPPQRTRDRIVIEPWWTDSIILGRDILVSDHMIVDHLPNRVGDSLRSMSGYLSSNGS